MEREREPPRQQLLGAPAAPEPLPSGFVLFPERLRSLCVPANKRGPFRARGDPQRWILQGRRHVAPEAEGLVVDAELALSPQKSCPQLFLLP